MMASLIRESVRFNVIGPDRDTCLQSIEQSFADLGIDPTDGNLSVTYTPEYHMVDGAGVRTPGAWEADVEWTR